MVVAIDGSTDGGGEIARTGIEIILANTINDRVVNIAKARNIFIL
jgi:hypothetical protein